MAEIVIARHGETSWNAEGRFQGHADVPLSERGREQAEALAERLASGRPFAAFYASDLRRAAETAEVVASRLRLSVVPHSGLREIDVGSWSGLTRAEISERDPAGFARWAGGGGMQDHGGEAREAFSARVLDAVLEIGARHAGERVLLVAHGGVVRALQRAVLGEPEPVLENCGTWAFRVAEGTLQAAGADAFAPGSADDPIV